MVKQNGPKNSDKKVDVKVETGVLHNTVVSGWSPKGRRVMIVSNRQALRDLLQKSMLDLGYEVKTASGSLEALKIIKSLEIELMLLESVIDGETCCELLNLAENVSKSKNLASIIICEDTTEKTLEMPNMQIKNLCVAKSNLSKEVLSKSARQLLDVNYSGQEEAETKIRGKVMICESLKPRSEELLKILTDSGLEVVLAADVSEGMQKVRSTLPDVIIVGAEVDGGGATSFISQVKGNKALESIPCLVLCDEKGLSKVRPEAFAVGSLGCVSYPLIKDEVLAQVGVMAQLTQTLASMQESAVSLAVSNFELVETRALLEEKTKQLEKSSSFKSEFLAKMSHELRTPLTGMLGFAQRLMDMSPGEHGHKEAVSTIMRNGDHLLELINDVLDLSKIEAGKLEITPQPCSPVDICHDVKALMQIRAEQKDLFIAVEASEDIPERIISDPMRVKQIILNLVGNAIKFTQRGGVRIVLSCDRATETMQFQVIDTGIGMSAEAKNKLFQAFVQGDTDVTRKFGGTGLGLTISLQLAELLGGSVTVDSILGMGSSFKVSIKTGPLTATRFLNPTEVAQDRSRIINQENFESVRLSGRILIAEDNQDSRKVLEYYLKKAGAEILFVDNGMEAVNKAVSESPDVVMMDMQMPVLNGYDATRKLREQGFTKPIVAISANALDTEVRKCLEAGCSHVQPKPFNWVSLFSVLYEFIGAPEDKAQPVEVEFQPERETLVVEPKRKPVKPPEKKVIKSKPTPLVDEAEELLSPIVSELFEEAPDLRPLIIDFVQGLDPYRIAIKNAVKAKDWAGLKQTAHDLSGIAGMYGYNETSEVAKNLRLSCMQREIDTIRNLSSELLTLLDRMKYGLPQMKGEDVSSESIVEETNVLISELVTLSPDLIPQVMEYIDSLGGVVAKINKAHQASNWKELKDTCNEAAGTAHLFGYPKLAEVSQAIEVAAREKDSSVVSEKLKELLMLKEAVERGREQISS